MKEVIVTLKKKDLQAFLKVMDKMLWNPTELRGVKPLINALEKSIKWTWKK